MLHQIDLTRCRSICVFQYPSLSLKGPVFSISGNMVLKMQVVWTKPHRVDKLVFLAHNLCYAVLLVIMQYLKYSQYYDVHFLHYKCAFNVGLITDDRNNFVKHYKREYYIKNALYTIIPWYFPYTVYHLYFSNTVQHYYESLWKLNQSLLSTACPIKTIRILLLWMWHHKSDLT